MEAKIKICKFCKIINNEYESTMLYKDEKVILIKDIRPAGKLHLLAIPINHIISINELTESDRDLLEHMEKVSKEYLQTYFPDEKEYK